MTLRRTIFQPDRDQEFPDDEIAMLEHQGLLQPLAKVPEPVREQPPASVPAVSSTTTVTAPAAVPVAAPVSKEASTDGGK